MVTIVIYIETHATIFGHKYRATSWRIVIWEASLILLVVVGIGTIKYMTLNKYVSEPIH